MHRAISDLGGPTLDKTLREISLQFSDSSCGFVAHAVPEALQGAMMEGVSRPFRVRRPAAQAVTQPLHACIRARPPQTRHPMYTKAVLLEHGRGRDGPCAKGLPSPVAIS